MLEEAKANIAAVQNRQKEQYDSKHRKQGIYCSINILQGVYKVGAKMLMKDHKRRKRKGGKMDPKWLGPYLITQVLGKGLYALRDLRTNQQVEVALSLQDKTAKNQSTTK